jgi:hypothetical protein
MGEMGVLAENAYPLENGGQLIRCCASTVGSSVGYRDPSRGRSEDTEPPLTEDFVALINSWSGLGQFLFPVIASGRLKPHLPPSPVECAVLHSGSVPARPDGYTHRIL